MGRQMIVGGKLGCMLLGMALAGCQAGASGVDCPLAGQSRMVELKLYFGRDIPGGGLVDDFAWRSFAANVLTPAFPEGFTVFGAMGQWRDPKTGTVVREPSFVVERIGVVDSAAIERVMAAYRTQFRQVSVGRLTTTVCAAF
jgi:hypothetical protein